MKEWNRRPVVKSVFYDDFSAGIRTEVWRALNEKWASQHNNGYAEENCLYTVDPDAVAAEGATGGLVIIRSNGDFAQEGKQRQSGGIVTKRLFGPGYYEARIKVVPRAGQCSALWTYFNDWAPTLAARRYSEIDIELPYAGDYRRYQGTTYENYVNGEERISRSEVIESPCPLNDGNWHVLAFEWRTDEENGDIGVIWYQDGVPVLRIREAVPKYTATFWVASLFQDAVAWLGDPQFECGYLYLDWVRITEYDDPAREGNADKERAFSFTGVNLGDRPVPRNEYLANGSFLRPAKIKNFKGREIRSWQLSGGAALREGELLLKKGSARQFVTAQYAGFSFEVQADVTFGEVTVFAEYYAGAANREQPDLKKVGESERALFTREKGTWTFCIEEEATEHIALVLEADDAAVGRVSMRLTHKK